MSITKIIFLITFCTVVFLIIAGCENATIAKNSAEEIAKTKLEEYCKNEKLELSQFSAPEISTNNKYPWIFDYVSSSTPKHLVRIYVGSDGTSEIHRLIE
jgi:hypothetical protein